MGAGDDDAWAAWSRDFAEGREPEAFWPALVADLRPRASAHLRGRSGEWEDVLQETMLGLLEVRAGGRFDPNRGTVVALAATILRRRCADRLRIAQREPVPEPGTRPDDEVAGPDPGPEEAVIESEGRRAQRRAFADAVRELQRQDERRGSCRAQAVLLRYRGAIVDDDWSFLDGSARGDVAPWKEVAERLGISVDAARQNGSRGLRALRDILAQQGGSRES